MYAGYATFYPSDLLLDFFTYGGAWATNNLASTGAGLGGVYKFGDSASPSVVTTSLGMEAAQALAVMKLAQLPLGSFSTKAKLLKVVSWLKPVTPTLKMLA